MASASIFTPSPAATQAASVTEQISSQPPSNSQRPKSSLSASSSLTTLLVISGAFAPIALIPYLLTRRHLSRLESQVRSLQEILDKQRQEWKHDVLRSRLQHAHGVRVMMKYRALEDKTNKLQQVYSRHYRTTVKLGDTTRDQMDALKTEMLTLKKTGVVPSSRLSRALADIAAFMHECEVTQGLPARRSRQDDRGIDNIRQLALELAQRSKS